MKIIGVIPARFGSSRFPGKPLHPILGKSLIRHVVDRCLLASSLTEVRVATDDDRIREELKGICPVDMTRSDHPSGTDRIAEVARKVECDAIVNIQGDEPLIDPAVIDAVAGMLSSAPLATAATPLEDVSEYDNPNVVKVVVNRQNMALYFSRRTIPYLREAANGSIAEQLAAFPFLKHLGIYGYRREALLQWVTWSPSSLEKAECLEQLRPIENGLSIAVARVAYQGTGVDVPSDVQRVEALMQAGNC